MKTKTMKLFFILVFLEGVASNLVHPVTPSLIINLNLPSFIFGLAFASMSTTFLLFSPFWGKMNENIGSRKVLLICCIGYGVGQFFFLNARDVHHIVIARLLAGMFSGGIVVSMMTYTIKVSAKELLSKNLTIYATLLAVGSATGYMLGGIIGRNNVYIPFYIQVSLLFILGCLFFLVCSKNLDRRSSFRESSKTFLRSNPINIFIEMKPHMNLNLILLSIIALFASTAAVTQDQNFNFYLRDVYNLNSSYNGIIKSIVAILGLLLNATLCKYIIEKLNISKSLKNIYLLLFTVATVMLVVKSAYPFIIVNIIYYGFIIVYTPLLQYLFTSTNKNVSTGALMGFYNALYSIGMIVGSLSAGALYAINGKLPFVLCAGLFFLCSMLMYIKTKKVVEQTD